MILKNKKQIMVIGAVLGLGLIIYILFKKKQSNIDIIQPKEEQIEPEPSNLDINLVLKQGSESPEVEEMQRILIQKYGQNLGNFGVNKDGIDGVFGSVTLAGLLRAKNVSQISLKDL